ncbi:Sigma factor binding protein 1, chloroplastic [Capsicum chinense]|nr:Sigma factor binding protein 1, chloroplastic [Capsicum chinense]
MDKMLSVHSKKANKQPKNTKKKTVKVVYISNPMKVNTSAAEFRALVQQLTGQHANCPVIETVSSSTGGTVLEKKKECDKKGMQQDSDPVTLNNNNYVMNNEATMTDNNSDLSFEDYVGEDYVPELLENLSSNVWYD